MQTKIAEIIAVFFKNLIFEFANAKIIMKPKRAIIAGTATEAPLVKSAIETPVY